MAIAYDAASTSGTSTSSLSWTHTPVGTPKGVLVFVVQINASFDYVSGVTYGGVAMAEVTGSPRLSTGEAGAVYAYFLGAGIPAGSQTVVVTGSGSTTKKACCFTVTASSDTYIVDAENSGSSSQSNPSVNLTIPDGVSAFCAGALFSGRNTVGGVAPASGNTTWHEHDFGSQVGSWNRRTSIAVGPGDFAVGWTQTAEDAVIIAAAIAQSPIAEPDAPTVAVAAAYSASAQHVAKPDAPTVAVAAAYSAFAQHVAKPDAPTVAVASTLNGVVPQISFDAATESTANSFTHTPVVTRPSGVLVLIAHASGAASPGDAVSGVTYGGMAMTEVALSPLYVNNGVSDRGSVYGYFLGSSVPEGPQTVAVSPAGSNRVATAITLTAGPLFDLEIEDTGGDDYNTRLNDPAASVDVAADTVAFVAAVMLGGHNTVGSYPPNADTTDISSHDHGAQVSRCSYLTNNVLGAGSFEIGWTAGNSYWGVLAVAIRLSGPKARPDAPTAATGSTLTAAVVATAKAPYPTISHDASSWSEGADTLSWTHTPVGTPKGVLVMVIQRYIEATAPANDSVTSVTYGGVTMSRLHAHVYEEGSERGLLYAYTLSGPSLPAGAQTVVVNTNATILRLAVCVSVVGEDYADFMFADSTTTTSGSNPSKTLSHTRYRAVIYAALFSGAASTSISPGAGCTQLRETAWNPGDGFANSGSVIRANSTIEAGASTAVGWSVGTDEQHACWYVVIPRGHAVGVATVYDGTVEEAATIEEVEQADTASAADAVLIEVIFLADDTADTADAAEIAVAASFDDSVLSDDEVLAALEVLATDSASTADDSGILAALSASDSASATDAATTNVAMEASDGASATDDASVVAALVASDVGAATDDSDLSALMDASDEATGTDAASFGVAAEYDEAGEVVDVAETGVALAATDSADAADDTDFLADADYDEAAGADDELIAAVTADVADAFEATDVAELVAELVAVDGAGAADTTSFGVAAVYDEEGDVTEEAVAGIALVATDEASATDAQDVYATLEPSDGAATADATSFGVAASYGEDGAVLEEAVAGVEVVVSDAAETDDVQAVYATLEPSEIASAADSITEFDVSATYDEDVDAVDGTIVAVGVEALDLAIADDSQAIGATVNTSDGAEVVDGTVLIADVSASESGSANDVVSVGVAAAYDEDGNALDEAVSGVVLEETETAITADETSLTAAVALNDEAEVVDNANQTTLIEISSEAISTDSALLHAEVTQEDVSESLESSSFHLGVRYQDGSEVFDVSRSVIPLFFSDSWLVSDDISVDVGVSQDESVLSNDDLELFRSLRINPVRLISKLATDIRLESAIASNIQLRSGIAPKVQLEASLASRV